MDDICHHSDDTSSPYAPMQYVRQCKQNWVKRQSKRQITCLGPTLRLKKHPFLLGDVERIFEDIIGRQYK